MRPRASGDAVDLEALQRQPVAVEHQRRRRAARRRGRSIGEPGDDHASLPATRRKVRSVSRDEVRAGAIVFEAKDLAGVGSHSAALFLHLRRRRLCRWSKNWKSAPFTRNDPSTKLRRLIQAAYFRRSSFPIMHREAFMTIVTPKFGMGASVLRRRGPDLHHRARAATPTTSQPAGLLHGFVLRSPVAKARFTIGSTEAAKAGAGRASGADRRRSRASRRSALRRHAEAARRHQGADPRHPDPVPRPRQLCRRCRRLHRRRQPRAGAGRRRADRGRLRRRRCRRRYRHARSPKARRWSGRSSAPTAPSPTTSATRRRPTPPSPRPRMSRRIEFVNNRLVCNYMEPRSAIGEWNAGEDRFVLTTGLAGRAFACATSSPGGVQDRAGASCASSRRTSAAASAPKSFVYREYPLVLEAAKRLGRPVKWTGDRTEHFLTDAHGRDNYRRRPRWRWTRTAASWRCGSICSPIWAPISRNTARSFPYIGVTMSTGVYDIQALDVDVHRRLHQHLPGRCLSRRRPAGGGVPAREAGRRLRAATSACGATRSAGAISSGPEQFPYRTQTGRLYDVGEFDGHMDARHGTRRLDGLRRQRLAQSKAGGKIRGIGMATYIEACAFPGSEPAFVELNGDGTVTLYDRHPDQRPGPRHRLCAVHRRQARLDYRQDRSSARATPTS